MGLIPTVKKEKRKPTIAIKHNERVHSVVLSVLAEQVFRKVSKQKDFKPWLSKFVSEAIIDTYTYTKTKLVRQCLADIVLERSAILHEAQDKQKNALEKLERFNKRHFPKYQKD